MVGEWFTRVDKSPCKSDKTDSKCCNGFDGPSTQALFVLQEVLCFFFQQDLSIWLNAFSDPSPWSVDSGIRPRRGVVSHRRMQWVMVSKP